MNKSSAVEGGLLSLFPVNCYLTFFLRNKVIVYGSCLQPGIRIPSGGIGRHLNEYMKTSYGVCRNGKKSYYLIYYFECNLFNLF
jgi:hypothetical protein